MQQYNNPNPAVEIPGSTQAMSGQAEPRQDGTVQNNKTAFPPERLRKLNEILQKYKSGKSVTDQRIKASEDWWKLRNSRQESDYKIISGGSFQSRSAWLHNVITNKHADAIEAYPEPNILPREQSDRQEAKILSSIIPVILEQNRFEATYSDVAWQKLKTGTGVYKIIWDKDKLNGLGDISIEKVNLLNLYWEPGITDIQKSRYFFHVEMFDREMLEEQFPEAENLNSSGLTVTKFQTDDPTDDSDKIPVVECYYHSAAGGKRTLQYVKFVGDTVLYATEDDPELSARGLYDHGRYPYVFDALFPVEGSPCGYGFVDLCMGPQTELDLMKTAFIKNTLVGSMPRYFKRSDGDINEQEFLDLSKQIVHVNGNLGADSIRTIDYKPLPGNYMSVYNSTINELRETSGNTETATGSTAAGVTAASAIAALQEASGKGSRDSTMAAYRAYASIIELVIELIRQFYDLPRQFRIVGNMGQEGFVEYSNANIRMQSMGTAFGSDMGYRLPVFDVKVAPQKRNVYTKMSQNELALQFYNLGFFDPSRTDQALATLDMMQFDGKDALMQKISTNGTLFQKLTQYMQLAMTLAQAVRPDMVQGLAQDAQQFLGGGTAVAGGASEMPKMDATGAPAQENTRVENARRQSASASQPEGAK